jgi:hypothetical protein
MAFVGDGYWKAIITRRLAKENVTLAQMDSACRTLMSNDFLAEHYPSIGFCKQNLNKHSKGTFIEAAIYLEVEKYGFDYVSGKFCGE